MTTSSVTQQPPQMDIMAELRKMSEANDRMRLTRTREASVMSSQDSFVTASDAAPCKRAPTPVPGLMTIEEWEAEMRVKAEQRIDSPLAQPTRRKARKSSPSGQSEPILLPQKTIGVNAGRLNNLLQIHRLTAAFKYREELSQCFSGSLTLFNEKEHVKTFATEGDLHTSKKIAKEKIAEKACGWLETLPKSSKVAASPSSTIQVDTSENWMGILNRTLPSSSSPPNSELTSTNTDFCQSAPIPLPEWQEYQHGAAFSTTCTLTLPPVTTFGDKSVFFPSKRSARLTTARAAVLALRAENLLPAAISPSITPPHPGLPSKSSSFEEARSTAAHVLALCKDLGIGQPQYKFTPDERAPTFLSSAAFFPGEPALRGPVGEARRVFGRKAAKEECAKNVLARLEAIKKERLESIEGRA